VAPTPVARLVYATQARQLAKRQLAAEPPDLASATLNLHLWRTGRKSEVRQPEGRYRVRSGGARVIPSARASLVRPTQLGPGRCPAAARAFFTHDASAGQAATMLAIVAIVMGFLPSSMG